MACFSRCLAAGSLVGKGGTARETAVISLAAGAAACLHHSVLLAARLLDLDCLNLIDMFEGFLCLANEVV